MTLNEKQPTESDEHSRSNPQRFRKLAFASCLVLASLVVGCGNGSSEQTNEVNSSDTPANAASESANDSTADATTSASDQTASPSLLKALEACSIPTVDQVRRALADTGFSGPLTNLEAKYDPPPPPPYGVAPEYAVDKASCEYNDNSESTVGFVFAISWITDSDSLSTFGPLDGSSSESIDLPEGALDGYKDDVGVQVLYPGVWVQWTAQDDPSLDKQIEDSIASAS